MKLNLFVKKNSDKILLGTGLVGIGVGVVMACKATAKAIKEKETYEAAAAICEDNKQLELAEVKTEDEEQAKQELDVIIDKYKKQEKKLVLSTAGTMIKIYIPSAMVLAGSVGCILGSHKILTTRNAALSAAYATIDKAYKQYRANVVSKYGEDVDIEMKDGLKAEKLKDGQTEKKFKLVNKEQEASCYARYFDESNAYWEGNEEYNDLFLAKRQEYLTGRLKAKGFVCLNEVYEYFGFEPTKTGQIVGWVYNEKDETRDNEIIITSKKIYDKDRKNPIYLLDFNVDGNVLDLI